MNTNCGVATGNNYRQPTIHEQLHLTTAQTEPFDLPPVIGDLPHHYGRGRKADRLNCQTVISGGGEVVHCEDTPSVDAVLEVVSGGGEVVHCEDTPSVNAVLNHFTATT